MKSRRAATIASALILLIAIYTGAYLILYHTETGKEFLVDPSDPFADPPGRRFLDSLFKPASIANHDLVWIPRVKRYSRGRWYVDQNVTRNPDTSANDYLEIKSGGECTYQLGTFSGAGTLQFDRQELAYYLRFTSNGQTYQLIFSPYTYPLSAAPKAAEAIITHVSDPNTPFHITMDPVDNPEFGAHLTTTTPPP